MKKKKSSRIIIDTNLWISFLIIKEFEKLDKIILSKGIVLVFSQELLDEFLDVVARPKFKKFFLQSDIIELLETIEEYIDFIKIRTEVDICRDPKDNFLLSLSVDGKVDYLLTGDKDLLEIGKFENTTIVTISDFLKKE